MGVMLSAPVKLTRLQRRGSAAFKVGVAEMQGWRTSHEDAHAMDCSDKLGSFWVLDGHGGDPAAIFCAPRLLDTSQPGEDETLPSAKALQDAFTRVDEEFRNLVSTDESLESGSTVVGAVAAQRSDGLYDVKIANCGDSRALIIAPPHQTQGDSVRVSVTTPDGTEPEPDEPIAWPILCCTSDHKPNEPSEKARIVAAGGFVSEDDPARLDGTLAVSRGMGDFEYKGDKGLPVSRQKVSCIPDIYEASGLSPGTIVLLACDGLWDVCTPAQVAEDIRTQAAKAEEVDLAIVAAGLVKRALDANSRDNITVMIAQLGDGLVWENPSNRFNDSDEMVHFDQLIDPDVGDEMRTALVRFLTRCSFPPTPKLCSETGRWFKNMWKCPVSGALFSNRHGQKKAWARAKSS